MQTCNFIFWSIIVPIATYGCELLILTDDHVNLLEEFQEYTGKKIQRFYSKTPKVCTFFALGWIRLQRYIEVKKLIFFHKVLALKDDEPVKKVLCERCAVFINNLDTFWDNQFRSPVLDFLLTAQTFG